MILLQTGMRTFNEDERNAYDESDGVDLQLSYIKEGKKIVLTKAVSEAVTIYMF